MTEMDQKTDTGGKRSAKIMKKFHKIQPEYHKFFQKYLCLTDINIYPMNNKTDIFWRNTFLIEKK